MEELEKKTIFTCKTITFTGEGKNSNNDFYMWREEHKQLLLPVKGRT